MHAPDDLPLDDHRAICPTCGETVDLWDVARVLAHRHAKPERAARESERRRVAPRRAPWSE